MNSTVASNSLSDRIVRNTVFNAFGRFFSILVGAFLTPYVIAHIGVERFGVWAIVGVLTGYFGLLDFGVSSSFVKYIAEFYTKKEYGSISRFAETGFTLYFFFALIGVAAIAAFMTPLLLALNIPPHLRAETATVLIIGFALFGLANAMSPFVAIQGGLQRMDISNIVIITTSLLGAAGTVFFLENGYGLIGLMVNNAVVFIATSVINVIIAFRILPELRFRIFALNRDVCVLLFRFGYKMQIAKISSMVTNQIDKILVTVLLSIGLVTYYQLGASIVYCAISVAAVLTSALMPAFSEIEAKGDRVRLVEAYLKSVKYFAFFVVPLFTLLIITAPDLIFIWLGYGFKDSVGIIRILAFAFLVNTIAQVPASVSISIDRPELMARGSVIIIILNLIFSVMFIKMFGFFGAAWGTFLAVNAGTAFFLSQLHASLKVPLKKMLTPVIQCAISSVIAGAVIIAVGTVAARSGFAADSGRIATLIGTCVKGLLFTGTYLAVARRLKLCDAQEAAIFKEKVPVIGPLIGRILFRI